MHLGSESNAIFNSVSTLHVVGLTITTALFQEMWEKTETSLCYLYKSLGKERRLVLLML